MLKAKKNLGQNFLIDQYVLNQIIEFINPNIDQNILEIGPGHGALTELLIGKVKRLDVVELDKELLLGLKLINDNKLHIHNKNILNFDISGIYEEQKIRAVGNLPYNISTPIMLWAFKYLDCLKDMHFMFQKEFGERLCSEPDKKSYGRISVLTQYLTKADTLMHIEPECFKPQPSIDSILIKFMPIPGRSINSARALKIQEVTKAAFMHRRKMIGKSLKRLLSIEELQNLGIDPKARPENISVEDYSTIAETLI